MKEAFLESMKYLYPTGIQNKHQHRDLVKVFCMGWYECFFRKGCFFLSKGYEKEMKELIAQLKEMTDYNWWPDGSWKWW